MIAPTRIGPYEIVRRLGKSMSDVYLAVDTVEDRKVALKLIPSTDDPAMRLIVEAERRGAAIQKELHELDHRMVEIYEYGEIDGYFFVAMQFVEGRSLADVLAADQVIGHDRASVIALEICEQLAKFHSWTSAVVHGDIKPSNIQLGPNETVRLLDFGIAKTLRADCSATGHNFGSPGYCSPERLANAEVNQQSDLWALGATLYEMLAGVPPYQAEDTRKLESLIRSKRPPRALPGSVPYALRAIVAKALAPDPAKRYRSALEFQADLQSFLERKPTIAEIERRSKWNPTATLEAAREALSRITRTAGQRRPGRSREVAIALLYFSAGMVLWVGGTFAWRAFQARAAAAAVSTPKPPVENLAQFYVAIAERILDSYSTSEDGRLYNFDWQKAEICLDRAVELGVRDDRTVGKLALSRGYAILERLGGRKYSEKAAADLRLKARDEFTIAAHRLTESPDPHLALARIYVYSLPNPEKAMAEFATAERLGARLGRREIQQQGDAYRIYAQQERASDWRSALRAAATARAIYESIPGFDQVDNHLNALKSIRAPAPVKPKARKPYLRSHLWQ